MTGFFNILSNEHGADTQPMLAQPHWTLAHPQHFRDAEGDPKILLSVIHQMAPSFIYLLTNNIIEEE